MKSTNVFVSCARSEGWNLPLIEAMACGTVSIYSNCSGQLEFAEGKGLPVNILEERPVSNSTGNHFNESVGNYYEPDFNHLSQQMRNAYENYQQHKEKALLDSEIIKRDFSWENVAKIGMDTINDFMERKPWLNRPKKQNKINVSYIDGPRVEVLGDEECEYFIEFIDGSTNEVIHSSTIKTGMWTSCSRKYYTPWIIKVNGEIIDEFKLEDETVLISLESKSLGDTFAWSPYAVEFQKKHNCNVVLSTHHNHFFKGLKEYENIKFITPGESVGCKVVYRLGWFRDKNGMWEKFDMYPNKVNTIPLQQTATDILGLEYKEVNHGVNFPKGEKPMEKEYVVFGPNATAGCKEWTYENWVSLSKLIKGLGYEVVTLTQQPYHIDGVINVWGEPFTVVANYLHHAKSFIGLGSGLSWFNWSLNKHTHMINGFAREGHEFSNNITRIYNPNICIYCWNDEVYTFDTGDWDWCPVYKGTKNQHICQKSITPLQVFNTLNI
jgi:autotransporter strand-loop-strand O-heptosyltransferase